MINGSEYNYVCKLLTTYGGPAVGHIFLKCLLFASTNLTVLSECNMSANVLILIN